MDSPRITLLLAALLALPASLTAQQIVDPAAGVTSKIVLENEAVRMVEVSYQPGGSSEEHTHDFPRAVYVIAGGTVELVDQDGNARQLTVRAGDALWRPAETHTVKNVGPTRVTLVETEIKEVGGT